MTARVDFFFSPGSRYSYLAATQITRLERETGCTVDWRPVHGVDIRRLRGRDPFSGPALSGQYDPCYRQADAEAWADLYGVPYVEPREFHFDFEVLVRGAIGGLQLGAGPDFLRAISNAVFASSRWPLDRDLLAELGASHGLDASRLVADIDSDRVTQTMAETAQEAFERGAFGVPTFFYGSLMFWGNDRLPLLRHALLSRADQR